MKTVGISNTGIEKTTEALRTSELSYRIIFEQAADAFMVADQHGYLLEVNDSFCKMMGYSAQELIGCSIASLLDQEHLSTHPLRLDLLSVGDPIFSERQMKRKDGTVFQTEDYMQMIGDGRIVSIFRNISARKQTENALRRSEDAVRLTINTIPTMAWTVQPDGTIDFVNQRWIEYAGEGSFQNPRGIIHPEDLSSVMEVWYRHRDAGDYFEGEMRLKRVDGQYRWFLVRTSPLRDGFGNVVKWYGISIDIEDSKCAEDTLKKSYEEIRRLTRHLQNIREEERTHIAREIHDELGGQLTVLKMDVSWLMKRFVDENKTVKQRLKNLIDILNSMLKSVRRISLELRPGVLDNIGLVTTIEWHLKEFEKRSGIKTSFIKSTEVEISNVIKNGVFRIFQESLTNVARHSQAKHVQVELYKKNDALFLSIVDDGKGFDQEKVSRKKTLGILGMKERTAMMGGRYEVSSKPGHGTTVTVVLPYNMINNN
jgi:PAS domain S-box-containing protein